LSRSQIIKDSLTLSLSSSSLNQVDTWMSPDDRLTIFSAQTLLRCRIFQTPRTRARHIGVLDQLFVVWMLCPLIHELDP